MTAHAKRPPHDLELGDGLKLPALTAVTQKFAIVARSGAGKSYAAGVLVEELHRVGAQVVILDPVGIYWALRLAADGKSPGLAIPVFGGLHEDLPLAEDAGRLVAQLVTDRKISAVLDLSMLRKGARSRFCADFFEELFELKKSQRSPVHLVIEEAHTIAPQRSSPDTARMLGAVEDVVRLGRNFGIGCTLIDQRPQSVNKDVLNQVEVLIALQTNGVHERKAIAEWATSKETREGTDFLRELPDLPIGTAYVWSPQWLRMLQKVKIHRKLTFDASRTPELGDSGGVGQLTPIDLEQIREAWSAQLEQDQEENPAKLRKRIAKLEKRNLELEASPAAAAAPSAPDRGAVLLLAETASKLSHLAVEISKAAADYADQPVAAPVRLTVNGDPVPFTLDGNKVTLEEPVKVEGLGGGEARMLLVLRQASLAGRHRLRQTELGVLSGYARQGGTFRRYLSELKTQGLVELSGDALVLTRDGEKIAPAGRLTADQVLATQLAAVGGGEQRILRALVQVHPDAMDPSALGAMVGYEATGGTFRRYVSTLVGRDLVERLQNGELRASDALFIFGRPA